MYKRDLRNIWEIIMDLLSFGFSVFWIFGLLECFDYGEKLNKFRIFGGFDFSVLDFRSFGFSAGFWIFGHLDFRSFGW
jgi:hypothetical protein